MSGWSEQSRSTGLGNVPSARGNTGLIQYGTDGRWWQQLCRAGIVTVRDASLASPARTLNPFVECAKRWTDTLNPTIDRTTWTPDAVRTPSPTFRSTSLIPFPQDAILVRAVEEHGKVWTKIVRTYFPGRTGLSAKNRSVIYLLCRTKG